MKVTLVNYTPDALETLIFAKNTRLKMTGLSFKEVKNWPDTRKAAELEYMRNTIQSSWEFVDYIFMIEDVTRAFTHQLVRHRAGTSFAQQAQRAVDMSGFTFEVGPSIKTPHQHQIYNNAMRVINESYQHLVRDGVAAQDARGVLPTNIHTNILFKANLRTLADMGLKRLCVKAQGEFQDVFRAMREAVIKVHPWASKFINVHCVAHGTCMFPTFPTADCPTKSHVFDPATGKTYGGFKTIPGRDTLYGLWAANRAEAQPAVPTEPPADLVLHGHTQTDRAEDSSFE